MKLASDASALVAEALRARGRRLISHHDLNLYVTPPTWSETVHEIGRRLDAMVRHGRVLPLRRDLAFAEATALLSDRVAVVTEDEYGQYEAEARDRVPRDPNVAPLGTEHVGDAGGPPIGGPLRAADQPGRLVPNQRVFGQSRGSTHSGHPRGRRLRLR